MLLNQGLPTRGLTARAQVRALGEVWAANGIKVAGSAPEVGDTWGRESRVNVLVC
jgi:hypothetical protein